MKEQLHTTRERNHIDDYMDRLTDDQIKAMIRNPKSWKGLMWLWGCNEAALAESLLDCYFGRLNGKRTYVNERRRRNDETIHLSLERERLGNADRPT